MIQRSCDRQPSTAGAFPVNGMSTRISCVSMLQVDRLVCGEQDGAALPVRENAYFAAGDIAGGTAGGPLAGGGA